jgi:MFS family permease
LDAQAKAGDGRIVTDVPARLERLPWSGFHRLVIAALGITWILDGLEVTLAGSMAGALRASPALHFDDADIGLAGSAYLSGAVLGALYFGWLTDRMGRRKLFFITLVLYLTATACAGLAWDGLSFFVFRFLTGAGIGGEYAAINSTIQELVPARYRGFTDLVVNGGFWLGAALGALVAGILLNPAVIDPDLGWRLAFLTGAALGVIVVFMRTWLPESPRWLVLHGRDGEADAVVSEIEESFRKAGFTLTAPDPKARLALRPTHGHALKNAFVTLTKLYPKRTLVGLTLMSAQAFFYNAIFFTYALVLANYYSVPSDQVSWHILPFALTNFMGPLLLGRLFDLWGRRKMLALTYGLSGALLLFWASLFQGGLLTATTQTIGWMTVFFFASPAASAAYLTVAENFPLEIRAMAIALFYAAATGIGGVAAPYVFGHLVAAGSRTHLFYGYLFAAALMLFAAGVAWLFAVDAEGKSLEEVAPPLSSVK